VEWSGVEWSGVEWSGVETPPQFTYSGILKSLEGAPKRPDQHPPFSPSPRKNSRQTSENPLHTKGHHLPLGNAPCFFIDPGTVVDTEFHGSLPLQNQLTTHGKCSIHGKFRAF